MQTKHLLHKHGGTITAVHGVGHTTTDGVPEWYYICDVVWDDGSGSRERWKVPPWALCYDGSKPESIAELNAVAEKMNAHLAKHGKWLKKAKRVGDYFIHWLPKKASMEVAI